MMADLVPERIRGRYFAGRGRIASFVTLIFSFAAGGILQLLQPNVFLGFALLFGGAMLFRFMSLYFLARMYELPQVQVNGHHERLVDVVKGLSSTNLGRFTIFVALISFSANLAAPFFTVFMLRDLHFSYLTFVIITSVGALTALFFLRYWGKRADQGGNVTVIRITALLVPFIPLLWLVNRTPGYLAVAETFSSFAWAGFNLAATNFVYDAAPPEGRTKRIAVFNALNGTAICVGALAGGFMANRLPALFGYNLLSLFAISGVLRLVVVAAFLRSFSEVRHVNRVGVFSLLLGRHAANGHSAARGHGAGFRRTPSGGNGSPGQMRPAPSPGIPSPAAASLREAERGCGVGEARRGLS
jgi:MFS family permease